MKFMDNWGRSLQILLQRNLGMIAAKLVHDITRP